MGDACSIETIKNIHEKLNELVEEHKEELQPLMLDKNEAKTLFASSGVSNDKMEEFDRHFDETAGEDTSLMVSNVMSARSFEVKTPDVVIKVKPERTDLIETKIIDGLECLVVRLDGGVEVNGITVRKNNDNADDASSEY